jgi:hypothetical protein
MANGLDEIGPHRNPNAYVGPREVQRGERSGEQDVISEAAGVHEEHAGLRR